MRVSIASIALLGGVFLLGFPSSVFAGDGEGEGFFSGSILSRLLPGAGAKPAKSLTDQALPSRFRLGFFSPNAGEKDANSAASLYPAYKLTPQAPPQSKIGLVSLGYGSYYGATRFESNISSLTELSSFQNGQDSQENLNLALEAGIRNESLNAGLLYAYQSGYPAGAEPYGLPSFPNYIFTPTTGADQAVDYRAGEGHAVFLYLGYNLSRQLNLRGSLGLAKTQRPGEESLSGLTEQSRRWGLDVAATYRLLDNLVYEAHLGYVSIEEAPGSPKIPSLHGSSAGAPLSSSGPAADSVYHIGSQIRMTF